MTPTELIRHADVLGLLEEEDLLPLASMLEPLSLSAGQVLIREGKRSPGTFLIVRGNVQIEKTLPGDTERVLVSPVKTGEWIGIVSLLDGEKATASVVATTEGEALALNQANFEALRKNNNALSLRFGRTVLACLAQQLTRVNRSVSGLRSALEQR